MDDAIINTSGSVMWKKTSKKRFSRRIDQDGSYRRCRAKTWGSDPRRGKVKRKESKERLKSGQYDF
jgi:hypothetical protein